MIQERFQLHSDASCFFSVFARYTVCGMPWTGWLMEHGAENVAGMPTGVPITTGIGAATGCAGTQFGASQHEPPHWRRCTNSLRICIIEHTGQQKPAQQSPQHCFSEIPYALRTAERTPTDATHGNIIAQHSTGHTASPVWGRLCVTAVAPYAMFASTHGMQKNDSAMKEWWDKVFKA